MKPQIGWAVVDKRGRIVTDSASTWLYIFTSQREARVMVFRPDQTVRRLPLVLTKAGEGES